jgi:hypothetical protein
LVYDRTFYSNLRNKGEEEKRNPEEWINIKVKREVKRNEIKKNAF